jgi:hypothetical protein
MEQAFSRKAALGLIIILGVVLLFLRQLPSAAEQRARLSWEYTTVCLNDSKTTEAAVQRWNALGAEGWEMVAYGTASMDGCSRFVFKRPR